MRFVFRYFPRQFDFMTGQLDAFRGQTVRLGVGGLLALTWASLGVFNAVSSAIDHAWGVEKRRSFLMHRLVSFLMMVSAGAIFIIALVLASIARVAETNWFWELVARSRGSIWLSAVTRRLRRHAPPDRLRRLAVLFIPNTKMRFRHVWPGAIVTGLLWRGALSAFSWYARDLARWNAVHGSIAAVVIFLFWIYISAVILLYGVEMTAAYARLQEWRLRPPSASCAAEARALEPATCTILWLMNRLAGEQSPYLLQHAGNPVDWYPWGDEAFERARRGDKPIFLSIGYSTCHWCHVMEHESFENAGDRRGPQRRVRVDQGRSRGAAGRRSGLHDVRAGDDRRRRLADERVAHARPAAVLRRHLLPAGRPMGPARLSRRARSRSRARGARSAPSVLQSAGQITARLTEIAGARGEALADEAPGETALAATLRQFKSSFDGGAAASATRRSFRGRASCCSSCASTRAPRDEPAREMVLATLRAMALGGMRDHIGGGFHRYSVDGDWRVPHFEKMLYDQAQLVLAYLEAAQVSGDPFFAQIAEDTLQYVGRDLTDERGGFYSAEDADSVPPEQERRGGARTRWKARSTSGRWPRCARCSATTAPSSSAATACCPTATRRSIRRASSPARTCSTPREASPRSPASCSATPEDVAEALTRARVALFERARSGRGRISTTRCSRRGTG